MRIEVFFTPVVDYDNIELKGSFIFAIDVLRAGTTICTALHNGADKIIPASSIEQAGILSRNYDNSILAGERNNIRPDGFALGNSPAEYTTGKVAGKTIVITTTNGTNVFRYSAPALKAIITGFVNITSSVRFFYDTVKTEKVINTVYILCAGNNGRFSYEDSFCAGVIVNAVKNKFKGIETADSAAAAENLYLCHSSRWQEYLKTREHPLSLAKDGFISDIDTAFELDLFPVVPVITNDGIVKYIEN